MCGPRRDTSGRHIARLGMPSPPCRVVDYDDAVDGGRPWQMFLDANRSVFMKSRAFGRPIPVILAAVLLGLVVGGIWWFRRFQPYPVTHRIRITICDVRDGGPVEGVHVVLDTRRPGLPGEAALSRRRRASLRTRSDMLGEAELVVHSTSDVERRGETTWMLILEKRGYQTETLDISPDPTRLPRHLPARVRVITYLWPEGADRSTGTDSIGTLLLAAGKPDVGR